MIAVRAALALVMLLAPVSRAAESPTQIVASVTRAVDHDSAAQARAAWNARLDRDPRDRPALLALTVLGVRTYQFATAESFLARLLAPGTPADGYAAYGAIEQAKTLYSRGLLSRAEPAFADALARSRASGDEDAVFESAMGLAMTRARTLGGVEAARVLDSLGRAMPHNPVLQAEWRCERAALAARSGDQDAAALVNGGMATARTTGDTRLEARCTWILAQDYVRRGDLGLAASLIDSAESMLTRIHEHAGLAAMLQWHGYLDVSVGDYGVARQLLERSVRESEISGNLSGLAWASLDLGQISYAMSDLADADRQAARAGSSFRDTDDHWGLANALGLRAQIATDVGDSATARAHYADLLRWAESDHNLLSAADARVGLADLAVRRGDWSEARRELDAQRAAYRRSGSDTWSRGLGFYYAVLALRQGDVAQAARLVREDLESLDTTQHVRRYISQATLAEIALRRGDTTGAEAQLRAASAQLDAWRATLGDRELRLLAFQVRDAFGGRPPAIASIIAGIARAHRVDAAFELAERRRARVLRDQLARAAALRLAAGAGEAARRRETAPMTAASLASIQQALPDARTALLEYVAGQGAQPTTLFVITRHDARAFVLAPIDSLRDAIARYGALLETGGDPRPLAIRLGSALLGPALGALPSSIASLVIVPDDALWRIPFQALASPNGTWIVERYTVSTSPSAGVSAMLWRRGDAAGPARLLAFGDPAFADARDGDAPSVLALRSSHPAGPLTRLPGTAREVRRVARYFTDPVIRLRDAASEVFLERTPLSSFQVLHFATHAVVDADGAVHAGLALAPGGGADGFVSDGDLAALHLDADLVVLSACHTAGGVVLGGEGMRGLTAPLLQAGARSVVATEWPVDDDRTISMVADFYDALARGMTTAGALRSAQLSAIRDGAAPREWAAFRVVGNPSVRVSLRQPAKLFAWPW